jgi:integrase
MATIRQRGANSWQIRADAPIIPGQPRQRHQKTIKVTDAYTLTSKRRLQQYLDAQAAEFQAEVNAGGHVAKPQRMTLAQFATRWREEHVALNLELKSQTNYSHHLDRRILPALGEVPLDMIQPMHITKFLADMRKPGAGLKGGSVGDATVLYVYRVMRSMFVCAVEWQVLKTNPMAGIRKPREKHKPDVDFYDEAELATLGQALAQESAELRAMVMLAVAGGLRRAEIAGLQWQHVDFAAGTINIRQSLAKYADGQPYIKAPKTKSSARRIHMPAMLAQALQDHQTAQPAHLRRPGAELHAPDGWDGANDFVFCHPSGRPVDPQRLTKWWISFHRKHGLRAIRLHDLRHTAAAWLIRANQHPKTVAGMLGHAQIKTSMDTYGHLMPSLYQQAAEAMDAMPLAQIKPTP